MKDSTIRVELVGLLPAFYRVCTKCQPMDYLLLGGAKYLSEQVTDYPPEVLEEQEKLYGLYKRLIEDFSGAVLPIPVDLLSLRGLWLSIRYKLGKGAVVVINGRRVFSAGMPYEAIKAAVEKEVSSQAHSSRRPH